MRINLTTKHVQKALREVATPERAATNAWFFKTGPGQYGEGDVFIGVSVPAGRVVAKQFKALPFSELETLLYSNVHEDRLCALHILVYRYKDADAKVQKHIYTFYIKHRARINNWDLVDTSAASIVGAYLFDKDRAPLYKLAHSKVLWDRRIAVVATHYFIGKNDFADTLALSEILMTDTHDLMHKAIGWMLREVGKRDRSVLQKFLTTHAHHMPRTMLRYAIEHFSPDERKWYMAFGK